MAFATSSGRPRRCSGMLFTYASMSSSAKSAPAVIARLDAARANSVDPDIRFRELQRRNACQGTNAELRRAVRTEFGGGEDAAQRRQIDDRPSCGHRGAGRLQSEEGAHQVEVDHASQLGDRGLHDRRLGGGARGVDENAHRMPALRHLGGHPGPLGFFGDVEVSIVCSRTEFRRNTVAQLVVDVAQVHGRPVGVEEFRGRGAYPACSTGHESAGVTQSRVVGGHWMNRFSQSDWYSVSDSGVRSEVLGSAMSCACATLPSMSGRALA